jgi:hypothetical protein
MKHDYLDLTTKGQCINKMHEILGAELPGCLYADASKLDKRRIIDLIALNAH